MVRLAHHVRSFLFFYLLLFTQEASAYSRLISLKPSATEMIFALGAGDRLVGVTTYCKHPAEAEKIAKVGGYSNPNLEKIISLKPDLVILIPDATSPRVYEALQRAHIETLVLKGKTLHDIFDDLKTLGEKLDVANKAQSLVEKLQTEIKSIPQTEHKQTAYMVVQRNPLIIAGRGTFLSELMSLAGLKNLGDQASLPYPRLSLEILLQKNPDMILDIDATPEENFWGKFPTLKAYKNKKIFFFDANLFIPSTQIVETLKTVIHKIHS
ncbi:MAG: cobalamin-binding protein [Deltaproteobacteria bacterium]|nr:MAG: cobalamin-binding protein [Deltaproteobacteria bacterium]